MEGVYDSVTAEYSGKVNLVVPFTMSQILTVSTPWNETHSRSYSQVCELDSDLILSQGLLDPDILDNVYRRVEARVWSCINQNSESRTTSTTTTSTTTTTPSIPDSRINELDIYDELSNTAIPESNRSTQYLPGRMNLLTIRQNKDVMDEVSRSLRYLDEDDEDAKLPEAYAPARSRSYKSKLRKYMKSRVRRSVNKPEGRKLSSSDYALGAEYLRKRIYVLETRYLKLIYLFKVSMNSIIKGNHCLKVEDLRHVIRCTHFSMSMIQASNHKRVILKILSDIIDLDAKIDDDTDLYDQYLLGALV